MSGLRRHAATLLLLLLALGWWAVPGAAAENRRLVAVGDVHGSIEGLSAILRRVGLVDQDLRWIGGDATLVQTGDLIDRGPEVRAVLNLMQRLQKEAASAGGEVVVLLGNHEAMNLLGIYRDVAPEAYDGFTDSRSQRRRRKAFSRVSVFWRQTASDDLDLEALEQQWHEKFPDGAIEYIEALEPEGEYGRWLRTLPVAFVKWGILFIHGGTSPVLEGFAVKELNGQAREELRALDVVRSWAVDKKYLPPYPSIYDLERLLRVLAEVDKLPQGDSALAQSVRRLQSWEGWLLASPEGPLWSRILAMGEDDEARAELERACAQFGVEHIVVGHTPQSKGRVEARFGGRLLLIDTGMLHSVYGGRPAAVEFGDGGITALYEEGEERLVSAER